MSRRPRRHDERGSALVELPLAFVAISILALCITALGQLLLEYHHLTGAARAAARFATKSDYDPTVSPPSASRRPSADRVTAYAVDAASPLPADEVGVTLAADDVAGPGITVEVRHHVNGGAYGLVTTTANGLLGLLGAGPLPDVTLRATSTAIYE
jgi:hypothetical protein